MKRISWIILVLLTIQVAAQERDTTKIKMGKKKIFIVESDNMDELEKTVSDFNRQIAELEDSISALESQKAEKTDQLAIDKMEAEIEELNKKIGAYKKGVAQTEKEMAEMKSEMGANDSNFELDFDNFWDDFDSEERRESRRKKRRAKFNGHWAGIEMGFNNYTNSDYTMELAPEISYMDLNTNKSWAFALNFMEYELPVVKDYAGFVTGLGLQWNSYAFDNNISLVKNDAGIIVGEVEDVYNFEKNKLNTLFLDVPLIFEFQVPVGQKDKRFHFAAGIVGSVKLSAKTKQVYERNNQVYRDKVKGDYQLSPLRYGATVRFGYQSLKLYANYSLVPLFESGKGPELYPFTVGLSLLTF